MIRPLTVATFLLACGSGLYLYQSKHEVQLLDRTIEKTVHDTGALREQSRLLSAEWTMLNDPERLRQFSDTYLNLRTINPAQFTSLANLDNKLPAERTEVPPPGADEAPDSADSAPQSMPEPAPSAVQGKIQPVPPVVTPRPAQPVAVAHPPETKVAAARPINAEAPSRPATGVESRISDQRASDQHPRDQRAAPRVAETGSEVRPVAPRPIILSAAKPHSVTPDDGKPATAPARPPMATAAIPAPFTGSLLGMAHGSMPPAPRPTPVSATYNAN
jgi:hypothetical protein